MDDGLVLRADLFAPIPEGKYPVILSYGVYAKGLAYQDGYPHQWRRMVEDHPEIREGSTNKYQNWEVTDPERWIPHGYVVIRVDSRGAGWSPGLMDCNSPREIEDIYQCIEWAGTQPWSNGKVGMLGISYYASNQWRVAGLHPPHLTAIIPWEGQNDRYRDSGHHGGILSEFDEALGLAGAAAHLERGMATRAKKNPNTGRESVAGPVTMSDDELAKNRAIAHAEPRGTAPSNVRSVSPAVGRPVPVTPPFVYLRQLGRAGHHPRGTFNGFTEHELRAEVPARGPRRRTGALPGRTTASTLRAAVLDHFLKGVDNGWTGTPRCASTSATRTRRFMLRDEQERPLARNPPWAELYLDPATRAQPRGRRPAGTACSTRPWAPASTSR